MPCAVSARHGICSPGNLTWCGDGFIYVQEQRSIHAFDELSRVELSGWKPSPDTLVFARGVAMDRSVVAPTGGTDNNNAPDIGEREPSGVLDVTSLYKTGRARPC